MIRPSLRRSALLNRLRKRSQRATKLGIAHAIEDRAPLPLYLKHSGPRQQCQMTRHHRDVHRAALGNLTNRTPPRALGNAPDQRHPRRIRERLEENRIKKLIQRPTTPRRLPGRRRRPSLAYLRHDASMTRQARTVKPTRESCDLFPHARSADSQDTGRMRVLLREHTGAPVNASDRHSSSSTIETYLLT